ncbi:MAG: TonB-dependent receptor [Candidatus Riflebacteria bacterium]|nr:TonB-dependent receptor [Candidatus Riflebacteria bacterium]
MKRFKSILRYAIFLYLAAISATIFAVDAVEPDDEDLVYIIPSLAVDADRATYQAIISRPQDEISSDKMQVLSTHNPVKMIRSQNSSIVTGGGLGGATINPAIRGLESRYTAVTVDGASVNTPWNWSSPLSGFPLSRLKKISVANTGSSMIYGQNTVAGAVNFVLPTARDLEGFTIVQEIGGEGTSHKEYIFGYAGEKSEHLIAVFDDIYDADRRFDNGAVINNRNDNRMFFYKGSYDLTNGWKFKPTIMSNTGSISVGDAWGTLERFDPWKMSLYNYTLVKDFNNNSNLSLRYTKYNDYSQDVFYNDNAMTVVKNPGQVDGTTNVDMTTAEVLYNFEADKRNYINVGVQNQKVKDSHDSVSADYYKKELDNTSIFVADSFRASSNLDLHAALRSDEDYEGDRDVSYSLNSNYSLSDKTSVGFGYSKTMQLPTLQDLYMGGKGKTYGNPNLSKEQADNYEIRLSQELSDKWNFNITHYNYDVEDKITTKTAGALGLTGKTWFRDRKGAPVVLKAGDFVKTNVEEAEISGLEFGLNGTINNNFELWLSYTDFAKAEDKATKVRFIDVPEYRATAGLVYKQNKTTAIVSVSHQGEIKATQGYKKIDASTITDLSVREQITDDFALYVKIANIGNDSTAVLSQNTPSRTIAPNAYYYEDKRIGTMGMELKF